MKEKISKEQKISSITFLNAPIYYDEDDKIGIKQHAIDLKDVISKGAKTIAVTSDFGGGKSSLIKYLESLYSPLTTKFCYVNLWDNGKNSDTDNINIHKSFIYQLADQIGHTRGNYVSKRLSANFGMFRISLPNKLYGTLSVVMLLLIAVGLALTSLYDNITKLIFSINNHGKFGVAAFVIAALIAILFLFKADVVFSAKSSGKEKKIDEHELMDVYRSYICKFHFRRFIIVIEDLDRSNSKYATDFIKEFRRYYIPDNNSMIYKLIMKMSKKCKWIRKLKSLWFVNKITYIVNIKSEGQLKKIVSNGMDDDLFSKTFDYVLDLKEVNISDYNIILEQLLEQRRDELCKEGIIKGKDDKKILEEIPEFEWVIRGKKIDIRKIKSRLNVALSIYTDLKSKYGAEYVTLSKCLVSAYLTSEFPNEYIEIKEIGFDSVIESFMKNGDITGELVKNSLGEKTSDDFAEEVTVLVKRKLIDYGYKIYFYNSPKDMQPYSYDQNLLANIMLYNEKDYDAEDFDELVTRVVDSPNGLETIFNSLSSAKNLLSVFPKCIFYNLQLFRIAHNFDNEITWKTIDEYLSYDDTSVELTADIINNLLHNYFKTLNPKYFKDAIERICNIIIKKASPSAIIGFRKAFIREIDERWAKLFISLFSDNCPILTSEEVNMFSDNMYIIELLNFDSPNLQSDILNEIHEKIILKSKFVNNHIEIIEKFYLTSYKTLGAKGVIPAIIQLFINNNFILESLEKIIVDNIADDSSPYYEKYIELLNSVATGEWKLSEQTIGNIEKLKINKGLNKDVCVQLLSNKKFTTFVLNAANLYEMNEIIDFKNQDIIDTINNIDYALEPDSTENEKEYLPELSTFRKNVLKDGHVLLKYAPLFFGKNPIIEKSDLYEINSLNTAISLINFKKISEENYLYIIDYFNCKARTKKEAYKIFKFICSIEDKELKRYAFEEIDFDNVMYYNLANKEKYEIRIKLSDCYDFNLVSEMIQYMTITKSSVKDFENEISVMIGNDEFEKYEKEYVDYINTLHQIIKETVNNYHELSKCYPMSAKFIDCLYQRAYYEDYIITKILTDKCFIFEEDRLAKLEKFYFSVFKDIENWENVGKHMVECKRFLELCMSKNVFKGIEDSAIRMQFGQVYQTKESVNDMFDNHTDICVEYFSNVSGFKDQDASECFIEHYKENHEVASSESVYKRTHEQLVNVSLKNRQYYAHKKAISNE